MPSYSGIGSRQSPDLVLRQMVAIARILAKAGFVLRSGGAGGADLAFEEGCDLESGTKEIYLPWKSFNQEIRPSTPSDIYPPTKDAIELAGKIHPAWNRCSVGAKKLHARNSHQILGRELNSPVSFVVCWHNNSGGTLQAVRLAELNNIPVYNLRFGEQVGNLIEALKSHGISVQSLM